MAEDALVSTNPAIGPAQKLVELLDRTAAHPRSVLWVYNGDTDTWRLWIVPDQKMRDKREFYRTVSEAILENREALLGIDAADVQYVPETHPAVVGLRRFIRVEGISNVRFTNNVLNGFYFPDAIIIRNAL